MRSYYFHYRLRMGTQTEPLQRSWYGNNIMEAREVANQINRDLKAKSGGKWHAWIDYVEDTRDGSTEYL